MSDGGKTFREMVAAEIRAEMGRQNLTQGGLAAKLGQAQPWVSRRVSGATPLTVDELDQVAKALDVPLSQLLMIHPGDGISTRRSSAPGPGVSQPGRVPQQRPAHAVDDLMRAGQRQAVAA